MDSDYYEQTEDVILNGQTKVDTLKTFIRCNALRVISAGSGNANAGIIYLSNSGQTFTSGLPTTLVYSTIEAGANIGANGIKTVPEGCTYVASNFKCSCDATEAKPLEMYATVGLFGQPPFKIAELIFQAGATSFSNDAYPGAPGKTDLQLFSKSTSGVNIGISTLWWTFCCHKPIKN